MPQIKALRSIIKVTVFWVKFGHDIVLFEEQAIGTHSFFFVLKPCEGIELHCSVPSEVIMLYQLYI